jgi:ligand-binding sensor domain-containing protein
MAVTMSCNSQSQSNKNNQSTSSKPDTTKLKFKSGVKSILEDSKGNTWFGSSNEGVCLLQNGKFQYFTTQDGLSDNQVNNIYEYKDGTIWFECGIGLSTYDGQNMTVYQQKNYDITEPFKLSDSDLWFKTDLKLVGDKYESKSAVYHYDGKKLSYCRYTVKSKTGEEILSSKSTGFVRSKKGTIWFGADGGLISYDEKQFKSLTDETLGLNGKNEYLHIRAIMEDSKGNLWIGNNCGNDTVGGIGVLKYDGKEFIPFTKQQHLRKEDTKEGNSLDRVFSIGEDTLGNIWFGTAKSGVWRYDGQTMKNFTQKEGLDGNLTWIIYTSKTGELWFGGGPNGVYLFNGKSFERKY